MWQGDDPTKGYVNYVDQGAAQAGGLIKNDNGKIYIGVDHSNVASGRGRNSVRLSSTKAYNHGLVIIDLDHMPGSICALWPALYVNPCNPSSLSRLTMLTFSQLDDRTILAKQW